ncbi:MAG: hypothetical protein K0Q76_3390 [Panacagrimonas sp.]|jgi:uncharacterized RDD family membrane protein YckC|nr:RDD family protein [Panacagrimonas sp.]MCC2658282.1 hypothetical protein [Panacagrimonas sp.]
MSQTFVPAPPWRRLFAAFYDGLVLLGLSMAALLFEMIVRENLLGLGKHYAVLQLLLFGVGLGFFGWFWVHGGQTLGMRAWRLQVRRLDGAALRWPIAAVRYTVMIATWGVVLQPALLALPRYAGHAQLQAAALACGLLALGAAALMHVEGRRRAPCDWAAGTEVVVTPPDKPAA